MTSSISNLRPDGDISVEPPPPLNGGANVQNMADLLRTGTPSQKTVILFEVSQMLAHSLPETVSVVVRVICTSVKEWDEDLQIAAAETLLDLSKDCKDLSETLAQAGLDVIRGSSISEDLYECWGEILVHVFSKETMGNSALCSELITLLKTYASDESKVRRKLAARLFGSLSTCLSSNEVESQILEHALQLADDRDTDVRGMLAESLAFIGATTSAQVTSGRVWPTIWGLLQDSDTRIRAVTLRAISNILDSHRKNGMDVLHFSKLLHPIFLKEASLAREVAVKDLCGIDDVAFIMLLILAQVFGQFVYSCAPHFANSSEKELVFQTYRRMSTCNSAGIRRYCAFNFPGVALIFADKQHAHLARILLHLCAKGGPETRCILAAGIYDSVELISKAGAGTPTIELLFNVVIHLLQDQNAVVQLSMTKHIMSLLPHLDASLNDDASDINKTRKDAIFRTLSSMPTGNWRAQELLATQIQNEVPTFTGDALISYILPFLFRLAEDCPYQVRKSAMAAIAKAIWYIPRLCQRDEAMSNFHIEWGKSNVFWMRMAFIECAEMFMGFSSKKMFKSLFANTLFLLADDPVPNVRMRLARCLHTVAFFCTDLPALKAIVSSMKADADVDVKGVMRGFDGKLEELERDSEELNLRDVQRLEAEIAMEEKAVQNEAKAGSKGKKKLAPIDLSVADAQLDSGSRSSHRASVSSPRNGSQSPRKGRGVTSSPMALVRRLSLSKLNLGGSTENEQKASVEHKSSSERNASSEQEGVVVSSKNDLVALSSPVTPVGKGDMMFGVEDEDEPDLGTREDEETFGRKGSNKHRVNSKTKSKDTADTGGSTLKKKKSFLGMRGSHSEVDVGSKDGGNGNRSAGSSNTGLRRLTQKISVLGKGKRNQSE